MIKSLAAAMIGALLSAVLLTAPHPAYALDPDRIFTAQSPDAQKSDGGKQRAGNQRMREPGRAERRKDYRPNQYRSNKYRNERPDGLRPEGLRPEGLRPQGTRPQERPAATPRQQERGPSALSPRDEGDRRALQQLMRHDRARRAVEQGTIRPLEEIRDNVQRQFNGRIVGLELYENPNRGVAGWVYDVRVLTREGNVMAVEMDARTGQVMSVRGKR